MNTPQRLEQFNVVYDAEQDRILLRFRVNTGAEFKFWLTRRFVHLLWGFVTKMAGEFSARKNPGNLSMRDTLAELAHGRAVNKADFGTTYQEGSEFPLGPTPILLAKIAVNPLQGDNQLLSLLPENGQGINLTLDENLLHVLARLIQEAATKADWGLALRITGTESPVLPGASIPSKMLH